MPRVLRRFSEACVLSLGRGAASSRRGFFAFASKAFSAPNARTPLLTRRVALCTASPSWKDFASKEAPAHLLSSADSSQPDGGDVAEDEASETDSDEDSATEWLSGECALSAAAGAAKWAQMRQLHDASFWRALAEAAVPLFEAMAAGDFEDAGLGDSAVEQKESAKAKAESVVSRYRGSRCASEGAASQVLFLLSRSKKQTSLSGGFVWCVHSARLGVSLALLTNSFKQMRVQNPVFYAAAERAALVHLEKMSLYALSLLCCSLAGTTSAASQSFLLAVGGHCASQVSLCGSDGDVDAALAKNSAFFAPPPSALRKEEKRRRVGGETPSAARDSCSSAVAFFVFASWVHLLGAFARREVHHQPLFEAAAPFLCWTLEKHKGRLLKEQDKWEALQALPLAAQQRLARREAQVVTPGALVVKAVNAFAA